MPRPRRGPLKCRAFTASCSTTPPTALRQEIKRITGVEVREAKAEIETKTGTVVQVFSTGTVVQVFLLAGGITADTWNGSGILNKS